MSIIEAAKKGDLKKIEGLLNQGADVNETTKKDETALHFAAQKGFPDICKLLLKAGSDASIKTKKGKTPLMLTKNMDVVMMLKKWEDEQANRGAGVLYEDLGALLEDGKGCYDLNLLLDNDDEISAHQVLVSMRCPKLRKMIKEFKNTGGGGGNKKKGGKDKKSGNLLDVRVEGMSLAEAKIILQFIYTGSIGDIALEGEDLVHVTYLANDFELPRLRNLLEAHLRNTVDENNVLGVFRKAHEAGMEKLKEFALYFIITQYQKVVEQDLTVVGDLLPEIMRAQATKKTLQEPQPVVVPPPELREQLEELLKDQDNCEIFLPVRGEDNKMGAHKFMLAARSTYFADKFRMGEKDEGNKGNSKGRKGSKAPEPEEETQGHVFPSIECLEAFLQFLYTEKVTISPQDALYLMPDLAENFYGLSSNEKFKEICEKSLHTNITPDNVLPVYVAACDVDVEEGLKEIALSKIVTHFRSIAVSDQLESLTKDQLLEIVQAFGKTGNQG